MQKEDEEFAFFFQKSEIWNRYRRLVYESPVAKSQCYCQSLLKWNSFAERGIPFHDFRTYEIN